MALIVALLMLVVITLLGFVAVRGTIIQQKMSTNLFDREVAFQTAEAGLRSAAVKVAGDTSLSWHDCQLGGVTCYANPFNDPNLPASAIHQVVSGTASGQFKVAGTATGQPEYVVEDMGNWFDPNTNTGFNQTANSKNYGVQGSSTTAVYYRITVRSGNPDTVGDRAVVTLQTYVKQD